MITMHVEGLLTLRVDADGEFTIHISRHVGPCNAISRSSLESVFSEVCAEYSQIKAERLIMLNP